ncbi:hypothetical protein [Streptomyces sp. NPDC088726]|uniref:hypothetical protein n=1 Tax=Streptomyces sp. NPDC088726 TaxID=3365874 RepID=UPI0038164F77
MSVPTPAVGRVVHYVSYGTPGGEYTSQCRAAIVTEVDEYQSAEGQFISHLNLAVLNPSGMFFNQGVLQDEDAHRGGTWHWPERA